VMRFLMGGGIFSLPLRKFGGVSGGSWCWVLQVDVGCSGIRVGVLGRLGRECCECWVGWVQWLIPVCVFNAVAR
jgi:hypothetical protein